MTDSSKNDVAITIPWSVKGVSAKARQTAKDEAAKSGQTIGSWLSQAIRTAAKDPVLFQQLTDLARTTATAPANVPLDESALFEYLQKMDQKLNALSDRVAANEGQSDVRIPSFETVSAIASKTWPA
ncbi:MAG: hypothetical protein EYC62_03670 [Alphaproteobacteria bacterium]|nr:MAG: hypothetical protein EYC62_03670 [Alphaproteobacteria bacterium]